MVASLIHMGNQNLKIEINKELINNIEGGNHLLNSLLPIDTTIKLGHNLFKHNIIYLEQIMSDNNTLLSWKQII